MTIARKQQVSLNNTRYYHCISRCVRSAFLCGHDRFTGKNFDHRKEWLVHRFHELTTVFAIKICAYSVMSSHYHLVLYIDADQAKNWSDEEVKERWGKIFKRKTPPKSKRSAQNIEKKMSSIEIWRERLTDISWFMRCLNESIARRANKEDKCKGRFWEGRFKSQALIDEGALLACMVYVDLNPIRAKLVETPEESEFTSIYERIKTYQSTKHPPNKEKQTSSQTIQIPSQQSPFPTVELMAFQSFQKQASSDKRFIFQTQEIPIGFKEYLELVDGSGRAIKKGKKGAIPSHLSPILERLDVQSQGWLKSVTQFEKCFYRVVGKLPELRKLGKKWGSHWLKGQQSAKNLYFSC